MLKIDTPKQKQEFKELLYENDINKILFSGKFGTGKTTFLRDFFEINEDKFIPIFLYPVNYSVSSNEDIFEYIKYDILIRLLEWENIEEYITNIPNSIAAQVLFLDNPKDFILSLVESYSKVFSVTKKIEAFISGSKVLKKELDKYQETAQIDDFLQELSNNKGSLFEKNLITCIINSIIERWKEINKDKKICLIIDDTDRIDPEHIFRIMNVFAAHNDIENESKNKFGFDKIITVCDVNNIQNIFYCRYGINTDFNGYISKFHSKSIFYFDFAKEIVIQLNTIFDRYKVMGESDFTGNYNFFYEDIFKPVISELLINHFITIRRFIQVFNSDDFKYINLQKYYYNKILYNDRKPEYILWLYFVLEDLFNGKYNMYNILCQIKMFKPYYIITEEYRKEWNSLKILLSNIIFLIDRKIISKINDEEEEHVFFIDEKLSIVYNLQSKFSEPVNIITDLKDEKIPLWDLLISAFKLIDEIVQRPYRG